MSAPMMLVLGVVAVFTLLPAVAMVIGGRRLQRRPASVARVPVAAVVVHVTGDRASRVTFDYPAPDGTWLRATRLCGLVSINNSTMTVHVDPNNPADVSLGATASAAGFGGVALIVAGCALGVFGLMQVLSLTVGALR